MNEPPRLRVNEIFLSIQGESARVGRPCVFVRLTGCRLRCTYCDTAYAFDEGDWMTLDEIIERVRACDCPLVEITGGEPLIQPNARPLMRRLCEEFETVLLETSGAESIAGVDPRVARIVDIKCPSSGESEQNDWHNIDLLTPNDELKFVVGDRADYDWAREIIRKYAMLERCPITISPVAARPGVAGQDPTQLAEWILEDRLNVRLGLQLHKILWPDATRGK